MSVSDTLKARRSQGKGLLAANFYNAETLFAILQASRRCDGVIILQTSPSTLAYLGPEVAVAMARAAAHRFGVRAFLHLDHASDFDLIKTCIDLGYDSVMIDASEASFVDNVAETRRVVEAAHAAGITVEAELGFVPKLGQARAETAQLTEPDDARRFVEATGVDLLAVAIGTAHGFYTSKPNIDFDRLKRIRAVVDTPLVLHGGSDVAPDQWQQAIRCGISKINFATEIKHAFMRKLKAELAETDEIDLRKVFPRATEAASKLVESKIRTCLMEPIAAA
jgi:fructose-bisphosphate aldolase class II/tagatose 1,6-diphosphate aldolase GatY/KbaY